jgi:NADPH-dependent curcumin reductase CurA
MLRGPVPVPGPQQALVRVLWLSCDPTQRGWLNDAPSYMPPVGIAEVMRAFAVGQVVESNTADWAVGDFVQGLLGWQDWVVTSPAVPLTKVFDREALTKGLGVFGITGMTAYFGMLDIGRPKTGEMVVVSGAAGATGSVAGQIARIKGCHTVGIAGGPEKCSWVTEVAGLDACIDYKNEDVGKRLDELCPKGIDIYFDNVGGDLLDACLARLAMKARVVMCGGISAYNATEPPPGPKNILMLIIRRARMEGFIILDYADRFGEAAEELAKWHRTGQLHDAEDVHEGLESAPTALRRLFEGRNLGKQLIKVAEPPISVM